MFAAWPPPATDRHAPLSIRQIQTFPLLSESGRILQRAPQTCSRMSWSASHAALHRVETVAALPAVHFLGGQILGLQLIAVMCLSHLVVLSSHSACFVAPSLAVMRPKQSIDRNPETLELVGAPVTASWPNRRPSSHWAIRPSKRTIGPQRSVITNRRNYHNHHGTISPRRGNMVRTPYRWRVRRGSQYVRQPQASFRRLRWSQQRPTGRP